MPDEGKKKCYAPVFKKKHPILCAVATIGLIILLPVFLVLCTLLAILTIGLVDPGCCIKQYVFQITHCSKGNENPTLEI